MQRRRKEQRLVNRVIKNSDIAVEVLDARFPDLTRSDKVESFVFKQNKPLIFCLNKCDLVPRPINKAWRDKLSKIAPSVYISSRKRLGTKQFRIKLQEISHGKESKVCIVGIPNTGKSSLINVLKGRHSAPTSPKSGFTRHIQMFRISEKIMVYDTPGLSPIDDLPFDLKIFVGAVPVEKIEDPLNSLHFILERIKKHHTKGLLERYQLSKNQLEEDIDSLVSYIAQIRGKLRSSGSFDLNETARMIIREFLDGKFEYFERPLKR